MYDSYLDTKSVYCDPTKLKNYLVANRKYFEIDSNGIDKFWEKTSNFLCQSNFETLSVITDNLPSRFVIPREIKEVIKS